MSNRAVVLIALLMGTIATCKADTIGPLTFGSSSPFGSDGLTSPIPTGSGSYIAPLVGKGISIDGVGSKCDVYFDYTVSFAYDMAPGWTIDNMFLSNFVDFGGPDTSSWGFEFAEKVTLCPTVGSCSTATTGHSGGNLPLPPVYLGSQATAGTGVYEVAGWASDQQFATSSGIQNLNIYMSPVPEPASFVLLAMGVAGLPVLKYVRRGKK